MGILDVLFPWRCVGCDRYTENIPLCQLCADKIKINHNLFCAKCMARLPACKKICHQDTPLVLGGAANYSIPAVHNLVKSLKFEHITKAAQPLAWMIIEYLNNLKGLDLGSQNAFIPIPLGPRRLRTRGFNQAELICDELSKRTGIITQKDILIRVKETKAQSELGKSDRIQNTQDCFKVSEKSNLSDAIILLIDDVTTTGQTLLSAASTLKKYGYKKIIGISAGISI